MRSHLAQQCREELSQLYTVTIPQAKPLSPGEILGCTAPKLVDQDAIVYDPYSKKFTREYYEHAEMHTLRRQAIETARKAQTFGLILGTLGRQGSPVVMKEIEQKLLERGKSFVTVLLSEIFPDKLAQFDEVDA
ncbi:Diphthamide biosynthesis protein 1 [Tieghemiomyces parasiticus]|uniref:2-(3-amino-3-carboxypropyl)histidine synthase subunit 1 n=1 Tax=Tieghemiomyces parasiticus TaxID=78921 RepID=A0A9W7ZR70_9FUNG|nr:Diphthamide biosynthesis protein 1 [Tieghemiomyces parasiticus]